MGWRIKSASPGPWARRLEGLREISSHNPQSFFNPTTHIPLGRGFTPTLPSPGTLGRHISFAARSEFLPQLLGQEGEGRPTT